MSGGGFDPPPRASHIPAGPGRGGLMASPKWPRPGLENIFKSFSQILGFWGGGGCVGEWSGEDGVKKQWV